MNKICTDIDQSRKLIELGIDPDTSDMLYPAWTINDQPTADIYEVRRYDFESDNDVPAWSAKALMDLIPVDIISDDKRYSLSISKYTDFLDNDKCVYEIGYCGHGWLKFVKRNDLIDTAFEIVAWLLEQGFFKDQ